jgi:putative endonuclease
MPWHIYIIECCDGNLYTGITKDLSRRLKEHNSGNGCKYTKYRAPVKLRHIEVRRTRPSALKREAEIKRFTRPQKLKLISQE